jgi:ligand-binding SRPBCC domain-containing protein
LLTPLSVPEAAGVCQAVSDTNPRPLDNHRMQTFSLSSSLWLPRPIDEVFEFFADARNLEILTPPWLQFEILPPAPVEIQRGTAIGYRLKLHGFPLRWDSEITAWEPPYRFVDEQRRGPYRRWVHEHRFAEQDGGTLVSDHVSYAVLGGRLVQRLFVAPDIRQIFTYRRAKLAELFGGDAPRQPTLVPAGSSAAG